MRALAALALFLPAAALAGTGSPAPETVITAEHLRVDDRAHRARFWGDVVLVRGAFRLQCPELVAHYAEEKGRLVLVAAEATGGVRFVHADVRGRADRARYDARAGKVVLIGHAVVEREGGRLEGARIAHDLKSGATQAAPPQEGGRVKVLIEGEEAP